MKSLKSLGYKDSLPMRLLKREILQNSGIPIDGSIQTFTAPRQAEEIIAQLVKRLPCLIVLSLPGPYHLPPFYSVDGEGRVSRRDIDRLAPPVNFGELAQEFRSLPEGTLVDLVSPLWSDEVVAARFMFASPAEQQIEAGLRCQPREIGLPHAGPSIHLELRNFQPTSVNIFGGHVPDQLFKATVKLLKTMSEHEEGLHLLAELGDYPTLEMAYHPTRGPIVIDLDWPAQWSQ